MASIKVNQKQIDDLFETIAELPGFVLEGGYDHFKSITPVRSGNARNNTKLKKGKQFDTRSNKIQAKYPYAGRLDEGWSKQARKGMTGTTGDKMDDLAEQFIRKEF